MHDVAVTQVQSRHPSVCSFVGYFFAAVAAAIQFLVPPELAKMSLVALLVLPAYFAAVTTGHLLAMVLLGIGASRDVQRGHRSLAGLAMGVLILDAACVWRLVNR